MPIQHRRCLAPSALLSAALLACGLLAPAGASAQVQGPRPHSSASPVVVSDPGEAPASSAPAGAEGEAPVSGDPTGSAPTGSGGRAGLRGSCQVSLEASSARVSAGQTANLSGKLSCANAIGAAEAPVTIYERQTGAGASGLTAIGTATTSADGSYSLTSPALAANSIFLARFPSARAARVAVKVAPLVTINPPAGGLQLLTAGHTRFATPGATSRLTVSGTVTPSAPGAHVTLQAQYAAGGEQWRNVAIGIVEAEGRYSLSHSFKAPGEVSVRVVEHGGSSNVPAASAPLSFLVAQAQNPKLTIQTSADPISSGQSSTISGVAAGAAGQAVVLLARTRGERFAELAKASTGDGGAYTFTVSPTASTTYRVISATAASRELSEGVRELLSPTAPPSSVEAGAPLSFSGTLVPAHEGQIVYLERENVSGVNFTVVAMGSVGADSSYEIADTLSTLGTSVMRIRVPPSGENLGSTSEPFTMLVTAASSATSPQGTVAPAA